MKLGSMSARGSDLEDGEIKDEAFEDISECSLSEILTLQEDLKDDSDLDQLREEALKSLQEKDEVTEEELYRFEALQSLLINIEAKEKKSKKRKRKKKSKEKSKQENSKRKKLSKELETVSDSSRRSENFYVCIRNKENHIENDNNLQTRSWYPKSDFALLDVQNVETSSNEGHTEDFIPVVKVLSPTIKKINSFENITPKVTQISVPKDVIVVPPSRKPNQYATVSKHRIRKFNNILSTDKGFVRPTRNGKYKFVNTSKYSLKKTNLKIDKTFKPNNIDKSKYSINRVTSKFPRLDPKDFVIELNEDSGNEEFDGVLETVQSSGIHSEGECKCPPVRIKEFKNPVNITKTDQHDSSVNVCDSVFSDSVSSGSVSVCTGKKTGTAQSFDAVGDRRVSISTSDAIDADQSSDMTGQRSISVSTIDTVEGGQLFDTVETRSMSVSTEGIVDTDHLDDAVSIRTWSVSTIEAADIDQLIDAMGSRSVSVSTIETGDTDRSFGPRNVSVSTVETIDADQSIDASDSRSLSVSTIETLDTDLPPFIMESRNVSVSTVEIFDTDQLTNTSGSRSVSVSTIETVDINRSPFTFRSRNASETVHTEQEQGEKIPVQLPVSNLVDMNLLMESKVKETAAAVPTPVLCHEKKKFIPNGREKSAKHNTDAETEMVNKKNAHVKTNEKRGNNKTSASNEFVLTEAEKCLIDIRTKLLSNLKDMEQRITRHDHEVSRLKDMMKNLLTLKSMTIKLEDKIRLQKSRLTMSTGSLQSLFRSITVRSQTCSQYKNVCIRAGMEVVGPQYKPPKDYEQLVDEKIKTLDFSKYGSSNGVI